MKAEAEADLQAAQPALEAALSALNSVTSKDIVSLKALKSPPDVIKRIMDCVLLLRHFPVNKATWQDVKGAKVLAASYEESTKMMADMNFLQSLLTFPKDSINDETVELLKVRQTSMGPDCFFTAARQRRLETICTVSTSHPTYAALFRGARLQLRVCEKGQRQRGGAVQLGRQHVQVP